MERTSIKALDLPYNRTHVTAQFLSGDRDGRYVLARGKAQNQPSNVFLERSDPGAPHGVKSSWRCKPFADDIPLFAAGYGCQADRRRLHRLHCPRDQRRYGRCAWTWNHGNHRRPCVRQRARQHGSCSYPRVQRSFRFNYNNHRMGDVSLNEVIGRLIFLIRLSRQIRSCRGTHGGMTRRIRITTNRQSCGSRVLDGRPQARFCRA